MSKSCNFSLPKRVATYLCIGVGENGRNCEFMAHTTSRVFNSVIVVVTSWYSKLCSNPTHGRSCQTSVVQRVYSYPHMELLMRGPAIPSLLASILSRGQQKKRVLTLLGKPRPVTMALALRFAQVSVGPPL